MPVYEYEPLDRDCFMCEGRVQVLQNIGDDPCALCPYCGLEVKKVVSNASFSVKREGGIDKAAAKGFSTFKRSEKGVYEKVGGEGPDFIVGTKDDMKALEEESKPKPKVLDLNSES